MFAITLDYFREFVLAEGYMEGKGRFKDSMTIDRDKEELGYVPGNLTIKKQDDNRKKYVAYLKDKEVIEGDIITGDLDEVPF